MERPPTHDPPEPPEEPRDEDTPYGAIMVTTVVAIAILVSWYGIYLLNLVRG